jgi:LemA protein
MEILYSFLFIIIIAGALAIYYAYQFNKLQHSKTKIDHAEMLIDESLRNRYDFLNKVDSFVKTELKNDKSFFKGLDKIKEEDISNFDLDRRLKEYIVIFEQIKTDYEELGNSKTYKDLANENKNIDERLESAKSYYNKYTSELNDAIRQFPSNIVAKMHGIEIKPFFDGKNMEDDIVNDFKF